MISAAVTAWGTERKRLGEFCIFSSRNAPVLLRGSEGALKECVIYYVSLATFSTNNPFSRLDIDEAEIGSERSGLGTLNSIYCHRP